MKALGLAVLVTALSAPAYAQETIRESDRGRLWWNSGDETIQDSKATDAAKFRVGSPGVDGVHGGGGAFTFDILNWRGRARTEVAGFGGSFNGRQGEVGLWIWNGLEPFGDATQKKVAEFFADHVEFKVPISAPNLTNGALPADHITSPNGQWWTFQQDDGNLVIYQLTPAGWLCPRWSVFTGPLPACPQ